MTWSFDWPEPDTRDQLRHDFGLAVKESAALMAEAVQQAEQSGLSLSDEDMDSLSKISLPSPDWINSNFWLTALWSMMLLRHLHPAVYYGTPVGLALVAGASISAALS